VPGTGPGELPATLALARSSARQRARGPQFDVSRRRVDGGLAGTARSCSSAVERPFGDGRASKTSALWVTGRRP
jgi:hypothetical protein